MGFVFVLLSPSRSLIIAWFSFHNHVACSSVFGIAVVLILLMVLNVRLLVWFWLSITVLLFEWLCYSFLGSIMDICLNGFPGLMTDELRSFLELNLPKVKEGKKPKFSLGTAEPKIGSHIFEDTKIPCQSNEFVLELLRGVRLHFDRFIKDLKVCFIYFFPQNMLLPFCVLQQLKVRQYFLCNFSYSIYFSL